MVVNSVCSNAKVMLDIGVVDVYKRKEKQHTSCVFLYKKYKFCVYMFKPVTADTMQQTGTYYNPLSAQCVVAG